MSADNANKIDIAPLTVVVSEALDPRVRRKLEAEQQADVKTYEELTRSMQVQEDLNKIRQEVDKSDDDDEADPFKQPEATENEAPAQPPANPEPAPAPAGQQQPAATPEPTTQPAPAPADNGGTPPADNNGNEGAADGDSEDLSAAFETHGTKLPNDLVRRVVKNYLALESGDSESVGELEHIKSFVFVDLSKNAVSGDTLESVQTLRDPENTIVVINESDAEDADTVLRSRRISQQLADRGARIFYNLDEATDYLNELYDIVSGRKKD